MAEFLTVNLNDILKNQKHFNDYTAAEQNKAGADLGDSRDLSAISDWAKELKTRLADNRKLPSSDRISDYDVESKFFEDYFHNSQPAWDDSCAKQLLSLGEPIKKVIKVLGFKKQTNPILSFITDKYVINNLIKTKLLNINTFKAIYEAVAKKLIANSELWKSNDYNVIYCRDLYKKSAADMLEFIKLQAKVLLPNGEAYSADDITKNKKTFFYLNTIKTQDNNERKAAIEKLSSDASLPSAKSSSTVLNKITFAKILCGYNISTDDSEEDENSSNNTKTKTDKQPIKVKVLIKTLSVGNPKTKKARFFAALQYINMHTGSSYAGTALSNAVFSDIAIPEVIEASKTVAKIMKDNELAADEVHDFTDAALDILK